MTSAFRLSELYAAQARQTLLSQHSPLPQIAGHLVLRVFDVEHGACAMMRAPAGDRLAMIDCGHNVTTGWRPSTYIRDTLKLSQVDYLFVTNADHDHLSDLDGLWQHGIDVRTLIRNRSPNPDILRRIKEAQGDLTNDVERFLQINASYNAPVEVPFDAGMGGVTCSTFRNSYPDFDTTNNLSMVVFIKFGLFKMLFPGDMERDGWAKLLQNPEFLRELQGTSVLVASHHGRVNGFSEDLFKYFAPFAVVISDKSIVHQTQEIDYRPVVRDEGVAIVDRAKRRHVLTTRRDGDITFKVNVHGQFWIETTKG
jgi:beta-lactamase superfamily II metal-dependent hydrolase